MVVELQELQIQDLLLYHNSLITAKTHLSALTKNIKVVAAKKWRLLEFQEQTIETLLGEMQESMSHIGVTFRTEFSKQVQWSQEPVSKSVWMQQWLDAEPCMRREMAHWTTLKISNVSSIPTQEQTKSWDSIPILLKHGLKLGRVTTKPMLISTLLLPASTHLKRSRLRKGRNVTKTILIARRMPKTRTSVMVRKTTT